MAKRNVNMLIDYSLDRFVYHQYVVDNPTMLNDLESDFVVFKSLSSLCLLLPSVKDELFQKFLEEIKHFVLENC